MITKINEDTEPVEIIENTDDAINKYGVRFGCEIIPLTTKQIDALKAGKLLAWNNSEYSIFIMLSPRTNS